MTTLAERPEVGDYDLRTRGIDDMLIGHVSETLIDADRMVREEWSNGFPNWALLRTCLAGDDLHQTSLREWTVALSCRVGQTILRPDSYSNDLACVAAWDALHVLTYGREMQPPTVTAAALGVGPKTYRRLRDLVFRFLRASLDEYWIRLGAAYRYALVRERRD